MIGADPKLRDVRLLQRYVVDPPVRMVWRLGLAPPGDAQLETIGRHTGQPHHTPICNGLTGTTFWLIAQHGRRTDYVQNLERDPRVRVRVSADGNWMTGTAHILDSDDPGARRRELGQGNGWRRLCLSASHAMSTDPLTIRIDLDQAGTGR